MWKALIHFPPLKKPVPLCSPAQIWKWLHAKYLAEVSPASTSWPPHCTAFYSMPLPQVLKFCFLNVLQTEHCVFVWLTKCSTCFCTDRVRYIQYSLSFSLYPLCVFHVCWKDKHSCTLMTLKCFWDSESVCVCVCVRERARDLSLLLCSTHSSRFCWQKIWFTLPTAATLIHSCLFPPPFLWMLDEGTKTELYSSTYLFMGMCFVVD